VPAAAVIPAPIAYIKVVAVKKLVVGFWNQRDPVCRDGVYWSLCSLLPVCYLLILTDWGISAGSFTVKKLECSKQAVLCHCILQHGIIE